MRQIKPTLIIISVALVIVGFIVSLLTNYASNNVPKLFKEYPWIIWVSIVTGLATLSLLTVWYYIVDNNGTNSKWKSNLASQPTMPITNTLKSLNYDAFISYSHKDSQWVREVLLPKLESHAFKVCIDFRDFPGGGGAIRNMEKAVIDSKRVILVLTENYIKSEWGEFENLMARTLDPAAIKRKVIPVLRESCDIPLYLKILTYRDLRSEDEQQWELLIRDLM